MLRRFFRQTRATQNRRTPYRPRLENLEQRLLLNAGELDATFGPLPNVPPPTSGTALSDFSVTDAVNGNVISNDSVADAAIQPHDGKIVVVGTALQNRKPVNALIRYEADGKGLDDQFGLHGMVALAQAPTAVAVRPTDKAIVVTSRYFDANTVKDYEYIQSFSPNYGALLKTHSFVASGYLFTTMTVQSDDKVLVGGYHTIAGGTEFAVLRFNTDLTLDGTFGTGGIATVNVGSGSVGQLAVQKDGKIVVAGVGTTGSYTDFAVARFNPNGTVDNQFGTIGKVFTNFQDQDEAAAAVALQDDGKIVAAGYGHGYLGDFFALARYNADGTLDSTFGKSGQVTSFYSTNAVNRINALAFQPENGRLIAAGFTSPTAGSSSSAFIVAAFNSDGTPDLGFGQGQTGQVITSFGIADTANKAIALGFQSGKLVAMGNSYQGSQRGTDIALARYEVDPANQTIAANLSGPDLGVPGQPLAFAIGATDPGYQNGPFTYEISWGDGATVTEPSMQGGTQQFHAFTTLGTYTVSVTAADPAGHTSKPATATVTVQSVLLQNGILAVGGTSGHDQFDFSPGANLGEVMVIVNNGTLQGPYPLSGAVRIYGNGGQDSATLKGSSASDTFTITQSLIGFQGNQYALNDVGSWSVNGLKGKNTFVLTATPSVVVNLDGGGNGGNWLDYSAYTIGVAVDLTAGTATGLGGVKNVQHVRGGFGDDHLTGGPQGGILIGGAGNDTLTGGAGRNILIGDGGSDTLTGGSDEDILIGGSTTFDANSNSLQTILNEWQRTDRDYLARVSDLKLGGGFNLKKTLTWGKTVLNDGTADSLQGDPAGAAARLDWFFAGANDTTDRNTDSGEQLN